MYDYGNMPVLEWNNDKVAQKAKAQILHQEPVILQMPDDFDAALNGDDFDCKLQEDSGVLYNCDASKILNQLATQNQLPALKLVAAACIESSSQVDIDSVHKRIIVHD